ncbi:hypothetical protein B566_EDAN009970 [Ephemera danica]|nr:hypothetical protein B566_EDAN009970 [Ephemera danica]
MSVHVTNTATFDDTVFSGHTGPILGVALDPKCEFLVSSSGDGTVRVWGVTSQEVFKTWYDVAPKGNDFFVIPSLARPCWQPKGRLLAIAAFKKIIIISRGTWETFLELNDPKVDTWYSVCQFSPCGSMLAACTKNGMLSVWNIDLSQLIASETSQRPIPLCGVAWNPKYKDAKQVELSLTDTEGHLTTLMLKLPNEVVARVYNSVGTVQAYSGESEEKTIDVEFHNNSVFHNFSLPNNHDHTMASLSSEALVLAGETQSSETGSKIQGMPLQGNTGNQFWSIDLPEDEEVVGLAASEDFIAVATNLQYLRLLTIGGVQREVYSIPGRFLCMAASKSKLMIVSHASPAMGSDQNLQFMLLKVAMPGVKVEMPRPLPISPKSELQWCGFTEESVPCTFDSSGVLRVLLEPEIWQVLCSTRALREAGILTLNLKSDHVFVVSVSLSSLTLRCILCKGSRYPHTSPTPTVVPVIMKVPTAEMHTDKGLCEGSLVQIRALCDLLENPSLADEFKDLAGHQLQTLSKAALKLFALTANQDTVKKTVEVYKLLPSTTLRELTRKYAQQAKKHSLLEMISELEDTVSDEFHSARDDKWTHVPARNTFAIDASSEESKQAPSAPVPILAPLMPRSALSRRRSFMSNPSNSVDSEVSLSRGKKL